ncbi:hypothetical protein QEZ63_10530 [Alcaligenes faecalis]|nr:hypothetical protein QEZ63_10530 [Alcaligenes faecalis]
MDTDQRMVTVFLYRNYSKLNTLTEIKKSLTMGKVTDQQSGQIYHERNITLSQLKLKERGVTYSGSAWLALDGFDSFPVPPCFLYRLRSPILIARPTNDKLPVKSKA